MHHRLSIFLTVLLLLYGCASVGPQPQRTCFHLSEAIEKDIGFCQALRSGNTLHVSGIAGAGSMDVAVRSVYARLKQTSTVSPALSTARYRYFH